MGFIVKAIDCKKCKIEYVMLFSKKPVKHAEKFAKACNYLQFNRF